MDFLNKNAGTIAGIAMVVAIVAMFFPLVRTGDANLGGGSRFPNGISADNTSPAAGEVRGADLNATDDASILDDLLVSDLGLFGTSTASGADLVVVDAPLGLGAVASTTFKIGDSSTTTSRAQFEMMQVDGGVSCVVVTAAGTAFVLQDGACQP